VVPLHRPHSGRCSCRADDCQKVGKHPCLRSWRQRATSDEETIARWWTEWPSANVGVVTGAPSGVVVIDVDERRGGDDSLATLESEHGRVPDTVEALTGSGGRHIWFAHPGAGIVVPGGADKLGQGIDVLADGQLAVVPGSRHSSGRLYEWEFSSHPDDVPLQPLPDWVLRSLPKPRLSFREKSQRRGVIPHGRRNCTLTQRAGFLVLGGFGPEAVRHALLAENQEFCKPPLPAREVEEIARSAAKWSQPPLWITERVAFISDPALDAKARLVLFVLCDHAKEDGTCHPGYRRLANITGISRNRIGRCIDILERVGRIQVLVRSHKGNRYKVVDRLPDAWASEPHTPLVVLSPQEGHRGGHAAPAIVSEAV
jgi:hypothetical protein